MSLDFNQKKQLLESIDYIDDAMLSDTLSRIKTDAAVAGRASLTKKRPIYWVKQTAALVACTLLLSAIIPILSYVLSLVGITPSASAEDPQSEEQDVIEQTEPEETDPYPGEQGSEGLRYMINDDGTTASFIGWGEFSGNTAYIASVYEGLPVTRIFFYEQWEQQERLRREEGDPNEQTIMPDDFSFPNIKHVVIPDSVEYVEAGVINQCDYIETLHIGAGVNKIVGAFFFNGERGQNFRSITVSPENQYYTEKGNCLIRIKDKVLLCGFADSIIPDDGSVEIIGELAFYNRSGVVSVVVPEGVIEIRSSAFSTIEELTSVSLPSTINRLYGAFRNHPALTEFKFAGTVEQWMDISKRGFGWIEKTSLTQLTCSDGVVELKYDHMGSLIIE